MTNDYIIKNLRNSIVEQTDLIFELFGRYHAWTVQEKEIEFHYRDNIYATSLRKVGWYFLLFVLVPGIPVFDYASITSFLEYLTHASGPIIGLAIKFGGWLMFLILELAIGWLLFYARTFGIKRWLVKLLAVIITLIPAVLIATTYIITPEKTTLLLSKTLTLMFVSIVLHVLVLLLSKEIWSAILHIVYKKRKKQHDNNNPHKEMKRAKKELILLFTDFDLYVVSNSNPKEYASYLPNRAWYLKKKFQTGGSVDEFDLSDYDPNVSYAPH